MESIYKIGFFYFVYKCDKIVIYRIRGVDMGAFEEFIESDAFFPVLIGLLVLLILVFVVILIIDRKREKRYIQELKEEFGSDEELTKTIQIPIKKVVKQVVVTPPKEEKKEEPIKIKEDKKDDSKGLDLSSTVAPTVIKENPVKPKVQERTEIAEDAPVVDLKIGDTNSDESLEATRMIQVQEEINPDDELIVPEEVKQIEEEGEEIAAPDKAVQLEDEGTQVIELPQVKGFTPKNREVEEIKGPSAFGNSIDGNTDINEDIKYDQPKEYTSNKTEVLDISDIVDKEE
jgi:hypothetical protein